MIIILSLESEKKKNWHCLCFCIFKWITHSVHSLAFCHYGSSSLFIYAICWCLMMLMLYVNILFFASLKKKYHNINPLKKSVFELLCDFMLIVLLNHIIYSSCCYCHCCRWNSFHLFVFAVPLCFQSKTIQNIYYLAWLLLPKLK